MTTSKDRYEAASTALGTAIDAVTAKAATTSASTEQLSLLQNEHSKLQADYAALKADFDSFKANAAQELDKAYDAVSTWAEGVTSKLKALA